MTDIGNEDGAEPSARVEFEQDAVVIRGDPSLTRNRKIRLYFSSLLGAEELSDGWRCSRRHRGRAELALQIDRYLRRHGYFVDRDAGVDESVRRDEERLRSFARTTEAARDLRDGVVRFAPAEIENELREAGWNFELRTLKKHQMEGVVHGLTVGNGANFSVPGAGKTATALALATVHRQASTIETMLVVGPLSSFRPWEAEAAAAAPWLRPVRVRGDAVSRRNAYRGIGPGALVIVSYATAAADQRQLTALCERLEVMLVVDESHRVKRFRGGTWAPALIEIAKHARVRLILSGTPMPQSGKDLYSQLNIIWPGLELTGPRDPFAVEVRDRFDSVLERVLPFVVRTPKAALGLTPPFFYQHAVELSAVEGEIYNLIIANLRRRSEAAGPSEQARLEALRRGRPLRLLQALANPELLRRADPGIPLPVLPDAPSLLARLDSYDSVDSPPSKSLKALDILRGTIAKNEKAVVWGNFIANLDNFSQLARTRLKVPVFQVDGRVPTGDEMRYDGSVSLEAPDTRERMISSFLAADGPAVLVANPASCSESISLHMSCHVAIYLDRTYDCAQWLQSIDRIHRLGLPPKKEVAVHVLLATVGGLPTADGLVDASLTRKERIMRQLLEGAELSPIGQGDDALEAAEGDQQDLHDLLNYLLGIASR